MKLLTTRSVDYEKYRSHDFWRDVEFFKCIFVGQWAPFTPIILEVFHRHKPREKVSSMLNYELYWTEETVDFPTVNTHLTYKQFNPHWPSSLLNSLQDCWLIAHWVWPAASTDAHWAVSLFPYQFLLCCKRSEGAGRSPTTLRQICE